MNITQDDLLQALSEALARPVDGDGLSGGEIQAQLDCGKDALRKVLRALAAQGRLDVVTIRRKAIDGRLMTLRGYRIKKAA